MTLGLYFADPNSVGRESFGKHLYRVAWAKMANDLPLSSGNAYCPDCKAEFDFDTVARTLNLLSYETGVSDWASTYKGHPQSLQNWEFLRSGKRSLSSGWLCSNCSTEFDDEPSALKLVFSTHSQLQRCIGQSATLLDWHRQVAGVPTAAEKNVIQSNLGNLEAQKQKELEEFTDSCNSRRQQLYQELIELYKASLLHGYLKMEPSKGERFRLEASESLCWESPAIKLKQRSRQGFTYWTSEGEGTLFVTNSRIAFVFASGVCWEKLREKLTFVDPASYQSFHFISASFSGLQRPVGLYVGDIKVDISRDGLPVELCLSMNDLLNVLRERY
jgi:hypothetical protein